MKKAREENRLARVAASPTADPLPRRGKPACRKQTRTLPAPPTRSAQEIYIILDQDGTPTYSSSASTPWLKDKQFCQLLKETISSLSQKESPGISLYFVSCLAKITRLDGNAATYYLAHITPITTPDLPPNTPLSPAQRKIARIATLGASTDEIASTLQRSRETIRTHLREIYRKLGVSSRLELTRKLLMMREK